MSTPTKPTNPTLVVTRPSSAAAQPAPAPPSLREKYPHLKDRDLGAGVVLPKSAEPVELKDIDIGVELEHAFRTAKILLDACVNDTATPLNQKAQIIGALNTILAAMTKQRADIYSAERVRTLESVLLKVLKRHPTLATEFLADYRVELTKLEGGK